MSVPHLASQPGVSIHLSTCPPISLATHQSSCWSFQNRVSLLTGFWEGFTWCSNKKKFLTPGNCEIMEISIRNAKCTIFTVTRELGNLRYSQVNSWVHELWLSCGLQKRWVGNRRVGQKSRLPTEVHSGSHWSVWLTACGTGIQSLENVGNELLDTQSLPSPGLWWVLSACSSLWPCAWTQWRMVAQDLYTVPLRRWRRTVHQTSFF